jgi:rubrerythrin
MMKTFAGFIMLIFVTGLVFSCTPNPVKTVENLKAAYNGESTASAKYAAFAEKARAEGFDTIAVMFEATSKSESIHAANHLKVLVKLGTKVEGPQIGTFSVMSTAENLADAIKGETYEIDSMYPGFISVAEKEKASDAVKSFTWANDTEKKHQAFYKKALDALNGGGENGLPASWMVCPTCGNTYDLASTPEACDFCMTKKDKFIPF